MWTLPRVLDDIKQMNDERCEWAHCQGRPGRSIPVGSPLDRALPKCWMIGRMTKTAVAASHSRASADWMGWNGKSPLIGNDAFVLRIRFSGILDEEASRGLVLKLRSNF